MRFLFLALVFPVISYLVPVGACAQSYAVYDSFSQLENRIKQASADEVLIINFWATFCAPCVAELPHFETLTKKYGNQGVHVLLVSCDLNSQLQKSFVPFLQKHNLKSEVVLLADKYSNDWIPLVDDGWDGELPATLVVHGDKRAFHLADFKDYAELEGFVQPFFDAAGIRPAATAFTPVFGPLSGNFGLTAGN